MTKCGWRVGIMEAVVAMFMAGTGCVLAGESATLLDNGGLTQDGSDGPSYWNIWNAGSHDPDTGTYRSAPNSWVFWWDGGMWQDAYVDFMSGRMDILSVGTPGDTLRVKGYFLTPSWDPLRNGSKAGVIQLEFYENATLISSVSTPSIHSGSPQDIWIEASVDVIVPTNANAARLVVRCDNAASGDGRFMVDDLSVRMVHAGDNLLTNPHMEADPGEMPDGWMALCEGPQGVETQQYRTANAWTMGGIASVGQDITRGFVPGDAIFFGGYLLKPSSDPFTNAGLRVAYRIDAFDTNNVNLLYAESQSLYESANDDHLQFVAGHLLVPPGAVRLRFQAFFTGYVNMTNVENDGRVILDDPFVRNLASSLTPLVNPAMSGQGAAPDGWSSWSDDSHDADYGTYRTPENAWTFWWGGGLYQDVPASYFHAGFALGFGGRLLTPSWDPLRNGSKNGSVQLEFYDDEGGFISGSSSPTVHSSSQQDAWLDCRGVTDMPTNAATVRLVTRCDNESSGDGRFLVDDVSLSYGATWINAGSNPSLAVVDGRPAVAFIQNRQLGYAINSMPDGSGVWSNCVVDTAACDFPHLAVIAGKPAIAYKSLASADLKFAICSTADGLGSWSNQVVDAQDLAGDCPTLAEVAGRPAIVAITTWIQVIKYTMYHTYLKYYINSAGDGSGTWTGSVVTNGTDCSYSGYYGVHCSVLKTIDGKPTIGYDQVGIKYAVNTQSDGSGAWNVTLASTNRMPTTLSMTTIGGKPAMGYTWHTSMSGKALHVVMSSTTNGAGAWSDYCVGSNQFTLGHALAEVDGKPAMLLVRKSGGLQAYLRYYRCDTADGSGLWTDYPLYLQGKKDCVLETIDGRATIVFDDPHGDVNMIR